MNIRTRVAPSPTGDPHVGTAYMALFSFCYARQAGGQFILRIEDTDVERSNRESENNIIDSLHWLGLDWDEGPDKSGPHGPYRQSERLEIYRGFVDELIEKGHAFHCFCTRERLAEMRAEQIRKKETARYDGHCMSLSKADIKRRLAAGEEHVVRMQVPEEGSCVVRDRLRGDITIEWSRVDMQILLKSDGYPTYHLAVVVDDHLMEITHIFRGEEWIPSAPKHMLLYDYFGWKMPEVIHMPLLRNPDKSKLSKRKNPTSIRFYERMGFLPEALLNYLGMLGWSMTDDEEKFSLQEMIEHFDLNRITPGSPTFDIDKLTWLNGRWLREELDDDAFVERISEWAYNRENMKKIIPLIRERVDVFSEVANKIAFFAEGFPEISEADFAAISPDLEKGGIKDKDSLKRILQFVLWEMESSATWDRDRLHDLIVQLADNLDLKIRYILAPVFIAVTGKPVSLPLFDSMAIIGPDMSRARIRQGINVLGGVSNKQLKKLEKEYQLMKKQQGAI